MNAYEIAGLSPSQIEALLKSADEDLLRYMQTWDFWARPAQKAPPGRWTVWMILAGRGFGKTRAGAEWVIQRARDGHGPIALIGETTADVRDVMLEMGDSSIIAVSPRDFRPKYEPSKRRITWPNGVQGTLYSGDKPDQLRGPQHATVWADELAKFRYAEETFDNMELGLRVGSSPRCLVTTTPRPIKIIKTLLEDPDCTITSGSTYENLPNLADAFRRRIIAKYEGTRLGRQELYAEVLLDNPGALWSHDLLELCRKPRSATPEFKRVVVGIDPSGGGDDIGIIAGGLAIDGHVYIIDDATLGGVSPEAWARQAVELYSRLRADRIVAERNYGGDMVEATLRAVGPNVPVRLVTASRGKQVRAEPVAALYEQKRVHHIGTFAKLEDEMTTWDHTVNWSPNRMDALVWVVTELLLSSSQTGRPQLIAGV